MERYGWLFMVVLAAASIAWAKPVNGDNGEGHYDANDVGTVDDANDIPPVEATDANDVSYVYTSESDNEAAGAYDDSNIHDAYDIINPIRLTAMSGGVTQSLMESRKQTLPTLSSMTIAPASPCSADEILVTFAGRKGTHYVIDSMGVNMQSTLITVDATWRRDSVLDGLVVDYSQTQSLGKLSAGTYTLQVRNYYDSRLCASITKFFTVTASSTNKDMGSLWDLLCGHIIPSDSDPFANWPGFDLFD
jgi:hypothetical protein